MIYQIIVWGNCALALFWLSVDGIPLPWFFYLHLLTAALFAILSPEVPDEDNT